MEELRVIKTRLENVERQNRYMKLVGIVAILLIGSLFIMGQTTFRNRVIEAEKFVLVDSKGHTRAILMDENGSTSFFLTDADQKRRIGLMITSKTSGIHLSDSNKTIRASLILDQDGNPVLRFNNKSDEPQLLMVSHLKGPILYLMNGSGGAKITFGVINDIPGLLFKNKKGKELAVGPGLGEPN
jgi:hypothetical protein